MDKDEWQILALCKCPACREFGEKGLEVGGIRWFCHRATHNLWTLLQEAEQIEAHLASDADDGHVNNSIYRPLIDYVLEQR